MKRSSSDSTGAGIPTKTTSTSNTSNTKHAIFSGRASGKFWIEDGLIGVNQTT